MDHVSQLPSLAKDQSWVRRSVASRRAAATPLPWASRVADRGLVWPVAAGILALPPRTRRASATGLVAVAAASAATGVLQQLVHRDRPPRFAALLSRGAARRPSSPSFPSAHVANATAFAAAVTLVRPSVGVAFVPLAGLVSVARVGIGHHYPTDVLAGAGLGAAIGLGVGAVSKRLLPPREGREGIPDAAPQ